MLLFKRRTDYQLRPQDFYLQTIPDDEKHVKMCGSAGARVVLVSGHPTLEERESGIPFATQDGRIWLSLLKESSGYDVEQMLIFSSSPYGKGPTVKTTKHTLELCQKLAVEAPRVFLFCGATEFGLTLNGFRKKASSGLYGAVMYLPQLLGSKVTVLPTPAGLFTESDDWKEQRNAQYHCLQLTKVFARLTKNLKNSGEIK